jgi:hypothetical protein
MGDTSLIVTETDSQYLKDAMPDFTLESATASAKDDAAEKPSKKKDADTATKSEPVAAAPAANGNGLTADFGNVSLFFPELKVRNANRNVKGTNGVSYASETPTISTKTLSVTGAQAVQRVQQRVSYSVVMRNGSNNLLLSGLGTQNGDWQELKGANGRYAVAAPARVDFKASPNSIRNAVQRAARSARMPRKEEQALLESVRNVRSVAQAPFAVVMRTAMWRVEGTDAKGKRFSKEVRVDLPM